MSASATDELAGGSPAVAKDGAEKEGGRPGRMGLHPLRLRRLCRARRREHFFYSMANTVESDKPM